jgi:hypothetical protein
LNNTQDKPPPGRREAHTIATIKARLATSSTVRASVSSTSASLNHSQSPARNRIAAAAISHGVGSHNIAAIAIGVSTSAASTRVLVIKESRQER